MTPSQYFVFNALWMGDGISIGELCTRVSLDSSTITGIKIEWRRAATWNENQIHRIEDRLSFISPIRQESWVPKYLDTLMNWMPKCEKDFPLGI